jgi:hypothetical protein
MHRACFGIDSTKSEWKQSSPIIKNEAMPRNDVMMLSGDQKEYAKVLCKPSATASGGDLTEE